MQRKVVASICFALMLGGTALFALVAIEKGLPKNREVWINLWPIVTSIGTVLSFLALRKADRQDPGPGSWQLTLSDLLAASLTFGGLLGILRSACDDLTFVQDMIVAVLITGVMIAGQLCASRVTIPRRRRALFGLTFALGVTGLLVFGGLLTVTTCLLVLDPEEIFHELARIVSDHAATRVALCAMLVGLPAGRYCYRMYRDVQGAATNTNAAGRLPGDATAEELKSSDGATVPSAERK